MQQSLDADTIRLAYELVLGRPPESEEAIRKAASAYGDLASLRRAFFGSAEFQDIVQNSGLVPPPKLVGVDAPPIEVEWRTTPESATAMLEHVRKTWTKLGAEKPHWSVLSDERFLPESISKYDEQFFRSGSKDLAELIALLKRNGFRADQFKRVFEFGCGLGRVTAHFARAFEHVAGCDVSSTHLEVARKLIDTQRLANVSFHMAVDTDFGMPEPFDLWYSRIVLQHNPPPIIAMILTRALSMLSAGGIAVFQVPTYAVNYRFNIKDYLSKVETSGDIEMHVLPQPVIFEIASSANCQPLEVLEDMSSGPSQWWNSTTFVFSKRN